MLLKAKGTNITDYLLFSVLSKSAVVLSGVFLPLVVAKLVNSGHYISGGFIVLAPAMAALTICISRIKND